MDKYRRSAVATSYLFARRCRSPRRARCEPRDKGDAGEISGKASKVRVEVERVRIIGGV